MSAVKLVPSPILVSKVSTDPHDPNVIGKEAVRLLNQSTTDTKYDPIPERREGEPFINMSTSPAIVLGTIGILLVIAGFCLKK